MRTSLAKCSIAASFSSPYSSASESANPPGLSQAGVRVGPGETQLERIPAGPNSMLIAFESINTAALETL